MSGTHDEVHAGEQELAKAKRLDENGALVPLSTLAVSERAPTAVVAQLEKRGVRFVRLLWVDAAGVRRVRVVPTSRFAAAITAGVGLSQASMWSPAWGDVPPDDPAAQPVGEMRLLPDLATLRQLPWHPPHALAQVRMAVRPPDVLSAVDPRAALERVVQLAQRERGLSLRVGYETEFTLLQKPQAAAAAGGGERGPGGVPPPLDGSVYCQSSSFDGAAEVLDEICANLSALGLDVEQLHPEGGHGQFEVAMAHAAPLAAADGLVLTKEAISAVAARHGLVASFLPALSEGGPFSGLHAHLSLWRGGANLLEAKEGAGAWGLPAEGEAFLAGILRHLPALLALTAPTPNSYRRLRPGAWVGAYQCWGFNNREAPLRLCPGLGPGGATGGPSANVEYKAHDGCANPHIALAAIIVAGLQGLGVGLRLPRPLQADPSRLPASELSSAGVQRLPSTLGEALGALQQDQQLRLALNTAFGSPDLLRAFVAVRRSELERLGGLSVEEEAAMLYDRY